MDIIAHRLRTKPGQIGNSLKNLMAVFRLDANSAETWIETDVSATIDGQIIIYHPGSIRPDLINFSKEELANCLFEIMTLEHFLGLLACFPRIKCCLDIKQDSEELVRAIVKMIINRKLQDRIYLTTFQKKIGLLNLESDGRLLILAKELHPEIKTHLIVYWPYNLIKIADKYSPDAISIGWLLEPPIIKLISRGIFETLTEPKVLKKQIRRLRGRGIKVWAGITNDEASMRYFAKLGVDGIMTDDPALGIKFKNELQKNSV